MIQRDYKPEVIVYVHIHCGVNYMYKSETCCVAESLVYN